MTIFFRAHFNALARILGRSKLSDESVEVILSELGKLFAKDNDRFSFERFRRAVYKERKNVL